LDKKISYCLTALVLISLIFAGCYKFGPTDKTRGELIKPYEAEFHKGFDGLAMEFVKGQPPSSVWENTEFPITIRIQNRGAYDIFNGRLKITGNLYFAPEPEREISLAFNLEGKSEFNPEGSFSFERYLATAGTVDMDKTDSFYILACYPYKTFASAEICINPRMLEGDESNELRGECNVGSVSLPSGQGAPVSVTSVDEEMIPVGDDIFRLNLKIKVVNKGSGKVVSPDSNAYEKDCIGSPLLLQEVGEIRVDYMGFGEYRLGGSQHSIICNNIYGSKFRLNPSGEFILDCFADLDPGFIGSAAFTTPLTVELSYGYSQLSEMKSITIKNSPNPE
jgi:hypothetical protein